MLILEILGIGFGALLTGFFGIFFRRRLLMQRGGTIMLQVRVTTVVSGRGWSPGIGQFVDDELRVHRMFSFAIRPKRVLNRHDLTVQSRRLPSGPERLTMPGRWIILRCISRQAPIEIAMAETTAFGLLSWLEAGLPGQPGSVVPRHPYATRPVE
ncbi:MAG TPA: DUF2550 domain-containing protein [Actinoplanes sp.]|nr:DUF2550 domain-containing protein [Actinoplanes sp.]